MITLWSGVEGRDADSVGRLAGCSLENLGDLDVGIGDTQTVGERGNAVLGLILNESEHVRGCLSQVLVCGHSGKRNLVREPIDDKGISDAESTGYVTLGAPVVLDRWTDVPSVNAMGCHAGSLVWGDMDNDASARWGQGTRVKIVVAVEAGIGIEARRAPPYPMP